MYSVTLRARCTARGHHRSGSVSLDGRCALCGAPADSRVRLGNTIEHVATVGALVAGAALSVWWWHLLIPVVSVALMSGIVVGAYFVAGLAIVGTFWLIAQLWG